MLPLSNLKNMTEVQWEEYKEYLNDSAWSEVTEGMSADNKYDFLMRSIEKAAVSVFEKKPSETS